MANEFLTDTMVTFHLAIGVEGEANLYYTKDPCQMALNAASIISLKRLIVRKPFSIRSNTRSRIHSLEHRPLSSNTRKTKKRICFK